MKAMVKHFLLLTSLCGSLLMPAILPAHTPFQSSAQAASKYTEVKQIPALLGLKQGDWIKTGGLATGKMQFTQLSPNHMQMQQEITLNRFARAAIEQVVGQKLSAPTNNVKFRFEVKKQSNGAFTYTLFDQGNNQVLLNGPVKVMVGSGSSARRQELEFKAPLVKMVVVIEPGGNGQANFAVGVVPVPGSLPFTKL